MILGIAVMFVVFVGVLCVSLVFEEESPLIDALLTSKLRACDRVGGAVILDPVVADLSQRLSGLAMKSAVVARKILGTGSAGLAFKQALVAFLGHGV